MSSGYPDYEGQKQKVYLVPEWAAKDAVDKTFEFGDSSLNYGEYANESYTVATGKTLYITGMSFYIRASAAANGDANQIGRMEIQDLTDVAFLFEQGGNGGGYAVFGKPLVIPAGHTIVLGVYCDANHACDVDATAWGYEI